jgi:hypothetical protein
MRPARDDEANNRWCLTNMLKCLILLTFVSYEAVRLWWWGGNCGVVSLGKAPFFCSIPTIASYNLLVLSSLQLFMAVCD